MPRTLVIMAAWAGAVAWQALARPVRAQAGRPVATLERVLEGIGWDAGRRGALLAVNPGAVAAMGSAVPARAGGPPSDLNRLRAAVQPYGRMAVQVGTLTAVVPAEMAVLDARPVRPDLVAGLNDDLLKRAFQASLTRAQWRLLGSARGLGLGDLSREQAPLFLRLIPDPFEITRAPAGRGTVASGGSPTRLLAPAERSRVRLRLKRESFVRLMPLGPGEGGALGTQDYGPDAGGGPRVALVHRGSPPASSLFGVRLKRLQPNRLKPSDLDYASPDLSARVVLEGASTVAELAGRAGEACGLEIRADPRPGRLPVWIRGRSARSGDVLKALALAVTGTFRRVGSAWVLTHDLQGLAALRVLQAEWLDNARAQAASLERRLEEQVARENPLRWLDFAENDPIGGSRAIVQRIEREWGSGAFPNLEGYEFPLSVLPRAVQAAVREAAARWGDDGHPVRMDRVRVGVEVAWVYVLPGMGEVDPGNRSSSDLVALIPRKPPLLPAPAPSETAPVDLGAFSLRVLCAAPATPAEARRAAREARRRGFHQLWVEVLEEGGSSVLEAAVSAGKEEGIAVGAAVRLLSRPPGAERGVLDFNVLGETASEHAARRESSPAAERDAASLERMARRDDWLRPDLSAVRTRLAAWLSRIAALPGLAALSLRDTAAIGYTDPGASAAFPSPNAWDLGFVPELRMAFLRQEGIDPLDLDRPARGGVDAELPFFPALPWPHSGRSFRVVDGQLVEEANAGDTPAEKWDAFRHAVNAEMMAGLHAALREARPGLPLYLRDRSPFSSSPFGWYGVWERADVLPGRLALAAAGRQAGTARGRFRQALANWTRLPDRPGAPRDALGPARRLARSLLGAVRLAGPGWDGIVVDLSSLPWERAEAELEGIAPAAPRPGASGRRAPDPQP